MNVLFFGTYEKQRHPRVAVLIEGLRSLDTEVEELNMPLGLSTAERVRLLRSPVRSASLAWRVGRSWLRLWKRGRTETPDAVVVGYLGHLDVHLARRLWPDRPLVLDHLVSLADTARDRGSSSRALLTLFDRIDRAATRAADYVLVDTHENLELIPEAMRPRTLVVPVGAQSCWFHGPRPSEPPLRVIFFGLYTPLQGSVVIGQALSELAPSPIKFTMVGSGQEREVAQDAARRNPGVRWIDWVRSHELPALVSSHDVCLGIFGSSGKALRVVPNKVYQGAAAGCAIVTSGTKPQRRVLGDAALYVPPGDPRALTDMLHRLSRDRELLWQMRQKAYQQANRAFRPEEVVKGLHQVLGPAISRGAH